MVIYFEPVLPLVFRECCSLSKCFGDSSLVHFLQRKCALNIFFRVIISLLVSTSICVALLVIHVSVVMVAAVRPLSTSPTSSLLSHYSAVFGKPPSVPQL